jgi:hypothetical protein
MLMFSTTYSSCDNLALISNVTFYTITNFTTFYSDVPTYLSTALLLGHYKNVNILVSHNVHIHFMYLAYVNQTGLIMAPYSRNMLSLVP